MGDTGAMLIGLLLAYGPISSTLSLDPGVLVNYPHGHTLNRFPTILPLLLPVAILVIPYADLLLAVVRRTAAGKSPFAPDRQHLHHRLLSMGHSHRQSVLLMYLWAALFSGAVVGLSVVRTQLVWLGVVTLAALVALLLATVPQLRPWHTRESRAGIPAAAPGSGAAGAPGGLPVSGWGPVTGVYPAPPVSAGPSSAAFPAVPPGPAASTMPGWTDAAGHGCWAQVDQEATAAYETDEAAGAYEADAASRAYETDEAAETLEADGSAPHWSLDDFPAPPRYPRR
jgi:UDP-GlcNAc:undecaprenyl-phosphate GlcNAc-1-phosphate transferase